MMTDFGCSRRKDGVIVETGDRLDQAGVSVRDWFRAGGNVLNVQIHAQTAVPADSWTMSAYDKAGTLLTSGRVGGPRARAGDTIWIKIAVPYRDLFEKADRIVIDVDTSAPSSPASP
jgi:hypothetical protein